MTVTPAAGEPARLTIDVSLAPLAAGDYALVLQAADATPEMAVPFRIVH